MATLPFKPNLAGKAPDDLTTLRFPVYVSPKLDGIRCLVTNAGPVSRNMKPIANDYIREELNSLQLHGFDGELIVGKPTGNDVMNRASSGVMRKDGEPDFTYYVFDDFMSNDVFKWRQKTLAERIDAFGFDRIVLVEQIVAKNVEELSVLEQRYVDQGYEGAMIRSPFAHYKQGRSTTKEGGLLKLKRFEDHEASVYGMVERFHNGNEATKDALGRTKRSTAKAGKTGTAMMGALKCSMALGKGKTVEFEVGTGFSEEQRKEIWSSDQPWPLVKFKCQGFTPDGVPRFPVFLGFRDARDMDAREAA